MVATAMTISAPVLITKDTLPKPIRLGPAEDLLVVDKTAAYYNTWNLVRAINVVGLEHNGILSKKEVYKPGETAWFHMYVVSYTGERCYLMTDGDVMYAVKHSPNAKKAIFRVTSTMPRMLFGTTPLDKKLLEAAIQTFFTNSDNK
jgi:hypothetical protein